VALRGGTGGEEEDDRDYGWWDHLVLFGVSMILEMGCVRT
jgi:hypothetical protein